MKYTASSNPLEKTTSGCLVLGFFEKRTLATSAKKLDQALDGLLSDILARNRCSGKPGETLLLNYIPSGSAERILLVGMGRKGKVSARDYSKAVESAAKNIRSSGASDSVFALAEIAVTDRSTTWKARQIVEISEDTSYRYTATKSDQPNAGHLSEIQLFVDKKSRVSDLKSGIRQGLAIANGMRLCKDLANLPGNLCTPTYLAEQAVELAEQFPTVSTRILDEEEMEQLGMGSLLSVSMGSRQPAKLIVMEYNKGPKNQQPCVLVGKGLTFDAGGISIKPAAAMDEMKYDMCGGASVFGVMSAVAELELPLNVVGIVPSSENLPDGNANKPGDIVTSMAGKTIEILNTDAEGRLILCDALTYAERYKPELVIDIATLTGACIIALGHQPSGLMGNDDTLCHELEEAGEMAGDKVWRLPIWDEYQDQLKSNFADIANIGGRPAGTITAACFLSRFTEKFRWAHLDIAGTAWRSGKAKGATGRPVPLLAQFLINRLEN